MEISKILNPQNENPIKPGFQNDINGLRGISVLMVVLYHFKIGLLGGGFAGVDIFFVISGFLMTKIIVSGLLKNSFNYLEFILRRALRIFPALFFLMLCLLVLGALLLPPTDLKSLAEQSLQAVVFNANNYFAAKQGYFTAGADDRWLLHTWSLAVEWQFYMLYPILIWLCFTLNKLRGQPNDMGLFHALLISAFIGSLLYCIFRDSQDAFFSVLTRAWQMIAGGLVYLCVSKGFGITKYRSHLSYAGFAVIVISAFVVKHYALESVWPSYFAILPVAGACMVLLASYENNLLLNNRVMQNLGKWSYSIYLWHWPLVVGLTITGIESDHHRVSTIIGVLLSIILGYLSYTSIESANYLKNPSKINSVVKLSVVGSLLLLASYSAVQTEGFIYRVSNQSLFENIATAESSHTYDVECENEGTSNDKFCLINPKLEGKKVLVLGDSHAGHLYPWFLKNSKVNTTFYVKSGCPLIIGFERVGRQSACREYSERAFALAESGEYKTVIISQNWTGFSSNSAGICSFENNQCVPLKQSSNPSLSVENTRDSIVKVLNKNVNVAVFDATPWIPVSAPKKIARDVFWSGKIKNSFDLKRFFTESIEYDQLFNQLKSYSNFNLLSLRSKLCQQENCFIYDAKINAPIFKDHDHFNPAWIIGNGDVFSPFVK